MRWETYRSTDCVCYFEILRPDDSANSIYMLTDDDTTTSN
jgi:hypothetical protein